MGTAATVQTSEMREPSSGRVPFLKWAGGKRWLLPEIRQRIPTSYRTYYEPFLGGGAIFFGLAPQRAVLGDINNNLVAAYVSIRDHPGEVQKRLLIHQRKHSKSHYYEVRALRPNCAIDRAAQLLYLNRTCFNGLYRVNHRGEFNVPIGSKTTVLFDDESFTGVSAALMNAELVVQDFEDTIANAGKKDVVYVDPPYTVAHDENGFVKYNEKIFSWEDQLRLRESLESAGSRGAYLMISNANHPSIKKLYKGFGRMIEVPRHSVIAGSANKRTPTSELLICVGV